MKGLFYILRNGWYKNENKDQNKGKYLYKITIENNFILLLFPLFEFSIPLMREISLR
jgi:hypothetical protein